MTADPERWGLAALTVLLWLVGTGWIVWRARRVASVPPAAGDLLIAVASQTGFGDELAEMTRALAVAGGRAASVARLGELDVDDLKRSRRLLFIASTTGEGDAPDDAVGFVRRAMAQRADLSGVSYGLLALGDRAYKDYCGFGRALDDWLRVGGATPLFERIEVDNGEAAALTLWREAVGGLVGLDEVGDWAAPEHGPWTLVERLLLNPGSPGEGAWRLAFAPTEAASPWVAGDIAEIGVPGPDGRTVYREYSVASLPADGRAEFLVRLMRRPDGAPGVASGWLTDGLDVGKTAPLRIRANAAFHGPPPQTPAILIGNGTGIAGLRAHLKERAATTAPGPAWLMFGERTARFDRFFDAELQAWRADGTLTRLDRVFSRDPGDGRYVQALIHDAAEAVRAWVDDGAVILVCGSLEGMAGGVHAALEQALGAQELAALTEAGRYRRDVY